jgi:hypothetical protein
LRPGSAVCSPEADQILVLAASQQRRKPITFSTASGPATPVWFDIFNTLFEPWFRGTSWDGWRIILEALGALSLTTKRWSFSGRSCDAV